MKKIVTMLVGAAALATMTVGMAANTNSMDVSSDDNSAAGLYVGGNLGYGVAHHELTDFGVQPSSLDNGSLAWMANVGYQFNKYLAAEAGYLHVGEQKASYNGVNTGITQTMQIGGFDVAGKGIIPINDQFSAFAKAGAVDLYQTQKVSVPGTNLAKTTGNAWTPLVGLGVSYNVNSNAAIDLQDVYTVRTSYTKTIDGVAGTVFLPSTNSVLAGVSYKFAV